MLASTPRTYYEMYQGELHKLEVKGVEHMGKQQLDVALN